MQVLMKKKTVITDLYKDIPLCILCRHYAYRDNDDTCVKDMVILNTFPASCKKFDEIESEKLLDIKVQSYRNKIKK